MDKKRITVKVSEPFYDWLLGQHTGHDRTKEGTLRRLLKLKAKKKAGKWILTR